MRMRHDDNEDGGGGFIRYSGFVRGTNSSIISPVTPAGLREARIVTEIVTDAFAHDPVWSWVFPQRAQQQYYWRMFIRGALRYPHVYKTGGYEAVSVWIPPDKSAFLPDDSQNFEAIIQALSGDETPRVLAFLEKFDQFHPRNKPHYYLGLLAVQNAFRGAGIGIELLKENLQRFDQEAMPTYLESSNPANNAKYEALGYAKVVTFQTVDGGPVVTGMWRDPVGIQSVS